MAIEIIKRGSTALDRIYETTCRDCSTIFRFERRDAITVYGCSDYVEITCPLAGCNNEISIRADAYEREPAGSTQWDR